MSADIIIHSSFFLINFCIFVFWDAMITSIIAGINEKKYRRYEWVINLTFSEVFLNKFYDSLKYTYLSSGLSILTWTDIFYKQIKLFNYFSKF